MSKDQSRFGASPVDHYLQSDIIQQLFGSDGSLTFSQLKPDGVENSLFMYHMRKLEDRGVVKRTDEGFKLTTAGVRWVNFVGPSTLRPEMLVRTLINFIVTDKDQTKLLASRRRGTAAQVLHDYLLPGGLHTYGEVMDQDAAKLLHTRTGLKAEPELTTILEVLHKSPDDYTHHITSFVYRTTSDGPTPEDTEYYTYQWVDIDKLAAADAPYGLLLQQVATRLRDNSFKPFETLEFDLS
ncbi:NUDIX domain-containing protein [Candidatus Saccharibacteria bacterium]|nr:NUDIX domain-containing protein [Candidatus Saccharibacteria bacterium]